MYFYSSCSWSRSKTDWSLFFHVRIFRVSSLCTLFSYFLLIFYSRCLAQGIYIYIYLREVCIWAWSTRGYKRTQQEGAYAAPLLCSCSACPKCKFASIIPAFELFNCILLFLFTFACAQEFTRFLVRQFPGLPKEDWESARVKACSNATLPRNSDLRRREALSSSRKESRLKLFDLFLTYCFCKFIFDLNIDNM